MTKSQPGKDPGCDGGTITRPRDCEWWNEYRVFKQRMLRQPVNEVKLMAAVKAGIALYSKACHRLQTAADFERNLNALAMWVQLREDLK